MELYNYGGENVVIFSVDYLKRFILCFFKSCSVSVYMVNNNILLNKIFDLLV